MSAKRLVIFAVLLAITAGVLGYFSLNQIHTETRLQNKPIIVVLKTNDLRAEFWQTVSAGVHVAAKEFGVQVEVRGPTSEADTAGQIAIVDKAVAEKPGAIVLAASNSRLLAPSAEKIRNANIPFVAIDSAVEGQKPQSYIAVNNSEAGRKAAYTLVQGLPRQAKVAVIGSESGSAAAKERELGVLQELEKNADVSSGGLRVFDGTELGAYTLVKSLLAELPDLAGIVALNESGVLGAGKAIKEKTSAGRVKLVGFDSSIYEIKLLEEGVMDATVVQRPFNMGYLGVKAAVQLLRGEKPQEVTGIDSLVITKETMYSQENQKILFPFVER